MDTRPIVIGCALIALGTILNTVADMGRTKDIKDLDARVQRLERLPVYQGKDANGNDVNAPAVTTVEIPAKH